MKAPATASDALQHTATELAEVQQRIAAAGARLDGLKREPSQETRVRLRREIESDAAGMQREVEDLVARRADLHVVILREAVAAKRDLLASALGVVEKLRAAHTAAAAEEKKCSDELNAQAWRQHELEGELHALESELAAAEAPVSPAEIARAASRARLLELARPVQLESDGAPTYSDPLSQPAPVLVNVPEQETVLERAERLAGRGSEALVLPDSVARINRVVPSAAQSQVVTA